jgi:putative ABC transport system permease protein
MSAIYRLALRLLPDDVRRQHGAQMEAVFGELVRDAWHRRGWRGASRAVTAELWALVWFAWCERRGARRPLRIDERQFMWPTEPEGRSLMLASLAQDVRYAARLLWRTPGFTFVCVATMALAIGANTAIFSVINGVLLKSLPFDDPELVVVLGHHTDGGDALDSTTPGNLSDWMRSATSFETMAGFAPTSRVVTWKGQAEQLRGGLSVGNIFDVLRRSAAEGRTLRGIDDEPGAEPVIVLSARLARRLFAGRSAVGASLAVNGTPHTVVGVMPSDFAFFDYDYEYWIPARFDAAFRNNRDQFFLAGIARLKPGTSVTQAEAQLNTVMDAIRRDYPQFTQNATAAVAPMKEVLLDGVQTRLVMLMGAVLFVLLIACANLGNLLLARASTRRREIALRHALGARPRRLVRQMLTESVLLASIGGGAGLALGIVLIRVLRMYLPENLPRLQAVELDGGVLIFTAAVSMASGILFGVFPALQLAASAPLDAVREGARGSARSRWVRTTLVASELALALMLLVGAGLLVRSFARLTDVPPGFNTERLLTFRVSIQTSTYKEPSQRVAFFERAAEGMRALPGVRDVALTTTLPVAGRGNGAWFNLIDRPLPPSQTPPGVPNRVVTANYFQMMGIPLRRGRYFTADDRLGGTQAVIVSESVARRFWPGEDALGKRIYMGAPDNRVVPDSDIVGIVADVKQTGLDEEKPEAVYAPHGLIPVITSFTFALRTSTDPATLTSAARDVIRRIDPMVPLVRVETMDTIVAASTAPARSSMVLVAIFAGIALALAIVGVFGVLSYTVNQQATELGIRMALGASARSVKLLVLGRGMAPVAAGVAIGIAGALALSQYMTTLLFGVTPTDPVTFVAVSLLLASVAAAATYVPARRATRVDPVRVLRQE